MNTRTLEVFTNLVIRYYIRESKINNRIAKKWSKNRLFKFENFNVIMRTYFLDIKHRVFFSILTKKRPQDFDDYF